MTKVFPSVSKKDEIAYSKLQTSLRKTRGHIEGEQPGSARNDAKSSLLPTGKETPVLSRPTWK